MTLLNNHYVIQGVVLIFMATIVLCAPGATQNRLGADHQTHEQLINWCYENIVYHFGRLDTLTCYDLSDIQITARTIRPQGNNKWIDNPHQVSTSFYTDGNGSVHDPAYIERCIFSGKVFGPKDYCENVWNYDDI